MAPHTSRNLPAMNSVKGRVTGWGDNPHPNTESAASEVITTAYPGNAKEYLAIFLRDAVLQSEVEVLADDLQNCEETFLCLVKLLQDVLPLLISVCATDRL